MVTNIGHDGSGVHCGESCFFDVKLEIFDNSNVFPKNICLNEIANNRLAYYYKSLKKPFFVRAINKLKKILKGK